MANKKANPLSGAFRSPAPDESPPKEEKKSAELPKTALDPKAAGTTPAKADEEKKPTEPPKAVPDPKATGTTPAKAGEEKKPTEPPKAVPAPKATGTTPAKADEEKKPTEPPKAVSDPKATDNLRFVKLTDIRPLPGTYVKDIPRKDYKDLIDSIQKSGLEKPVILRQGEKGDYQLVDGFHRCEALKQAGILEVRADVYEMPLSAANLYRKGHRDRPDLPIPGKLVPLHPAEPPKEAELPIATIGQGEKEEILKDYYVPTSKEGQSDIITALKVDDIHPREGHPFNAGDDDTMRELVDSVKKFGVREPAVVIPRQAGGYEMVSGHRRLLACQLAGIQTMPVIVRQVDSDKVIVGAEEIPDDFKLPITKEGQSDIVTTLKVDDIHPFDVKDDKDMLDLVDSVKKFGVLEPAVVIPRKEGGYEMVSGHRRQMACRRAGIQTMPVIVRQLDRDEAIIVMVDSNLKRESVSVMEKARAYSMKLGAMKRKAGRRSKEEIIGGEKPMRADEQLAQQTGESRSNIQKIVRLNNLTPELQKMVEEKKLPVHTAADLSYLKKEEQSAVADAIQKEDKVPSGTQAVELKKASQAGTLTKEKIEKTVAPTKREETPVLKITLGEEDLRPYFPDARTTIPDVKRGVLEALDIRKKVIERQKAKAQAQAQPEKDGKGKKSPSPAR